MQNPKVRFEGGNPIFRVKELDASLDYYTRVLGFTKDWACPLIASVSRDRFHLFLSEGDQGNPGAWAWIGVTDVFALHEELVNTGARVRHPPTHYPWACEMQVEDFDSNVLRFGSEPDSNQPTGDWLDMYGHVWKASASGGWERQD